MKVVPFRPGQKVRLVSLRRNGTFFGIENPTGLVCTVVKNVGNGYIATLDTAVVNKHGKLIEEVYVYDREIIEHRRVLRKR